MIRQRLLAVCAALGLTTVVLGATACETFPSGCVWIPAHEVPDPNWWDNTNKAVWWVNGGGNTFVGVSGGSPQHDQTPTWHGPPQYNGGANLAEYRSALRCYNTGGANATPS